MPPQPLLPGTSFGAWRVSPIAETRFDLPDTSMAGGMDSAFFLTRNRNVIPHEYPCRTAFAAAFRDRRPEVRSAPDFTTNHLCFEAPDLDLSGFWFRPTRIAAWAKTRLVAAAEGTARFRLSTCGGAVLFVNGREAGFLAPYLRNQERSIEIVAQMPEGTSELEIFLDDLAERDTRFAVRLDWLDGPPARAVPPFEADPVAVAEVEAALAAMHFERPSLASGEIRLVLPVPLPRDARATLHVAEEMGATGSRPAGSAHLPASAPTAVLARAEDLPAGFRTLAVSLEADGFAASRKLGLEVVRGGEAAPADLPARIAEALHHVAEHGEPDSVTALARLALGRTGAATEALIERDLGPIADCWDCADFALVPLLWARRRYGSSLSPTLRAQIDATAAGYRYWLDEPGNDVQWYFSENHALLFHTAAYLAGDSLPETRFTRSGRTGAEQSAVGRDRVRAWLDHFERWEMAEFNSAPYFPIDLKGLCALFALAPDADIAARAGRGIARLVEIVANSAHQGVLTAAQGRSYEHSLCPAAALELSSVARLLWGKGGFGSRFHCLPLLALCLRDHGLVLPDLAARAFWAGDGAQEWCFRQGENGFTGLYHYKCRAFAIGSAARYRWGEWGYQETLIHARLGEDPQAQILDQPPRRARPGRLRTALLLGRQRFDPARPAIPRPLHRRLRRRAAPARPHPRLVPARRLRRERRARRRRLRPRRRRPRRPPRRRPPRDGDLRPQRQLRAPPRRPPRPLGPAARRHRPPRRLRRLPHPLRRPVPPRDRRRPHRR